MKRLFVFAICSAILFSSCHYFHGERIDGNGNVITQTRNFSNFTGVDVSNAIHLYIKQDAAFSVKVETDENLQQYIIVSEENGILRIKQENNTSLDATGQIKVYVSAPLFKNLEASGACKIVGENALTASDAIDVHVSGASGIRLKGETKEFLMEGDGASHAKCFELMTENADVDVSGASNAEVFARVKINAKASGASDIRYKGNASVTPNTSGAASIKKAD